jgi:hypothetical protein
MLKQGDKNICPECNREVKYDGVNIVGIEINKIFIAIHRGCFSPFSLRRKLL